MINHDKTNNRRDERPHQFNKLNARGATAKDGPKTGGFNNEKDTCSTRNRRRTYRRRHNLPGRNDHNRSGRRRGMETATGHAYQFKGVEDWTPGDLAAVIMYDGGTREDVRDDQILKVRYSGSLEQFAGRLK